MKNTQPTLQEKKDKAIELMKRLDIFKPFIDDFKDRDLVCYFERYIGYWVYLSRIQLRSLRHNARNIEHRRALELSYSPELSRRMGRPYLQTEQRRIYCFRIRMEQVR